MIYDYTRGKPQKRSASWRFGFIPLTFIIALLVSSLGWSQSAVHLGGSGTETSNYSPNYYLYNYSYSQVIYTAAEMVAQGAVAGEITKIRYKAKASMPTTYWKDWIVYMGTTTKTNFSQLPTGFRSLP